MSSKYGLTAVRVNAKIIGAGIFGCACARVLADAGVRVAVIDSRDRIGGNCSTYDEGGIEVHRYGSHIFHTDDEDVWKFVSRFAEFNRYRHQVLAEHDGAKYFLPFGLHLVNAFFKKNMNPTEAASFLESVREPIQKPANLEEQAISLVGRGVYDAFVKNYTKKQWRTDPSRLDPSIIRRLPFRLTYDTSYFNDKHQGIPVQGYQRMFENMLDHQNIAVTLGKTYSKQDLLSEPESTAVIYTGPLDEFFGYEHGTLQWRSLRFETETLDAANFQGTAVVNYVDEFPEYTRIHEFRHYHPERAAVAHTVIQREYPQDWAAGLDRYYPVNTAESGAVQSLYEAEASKFKNLYIGGRLGMYRYFDMDDAVHTAFGLCCKILV